MENSIPADQFEEDESAVHCSFSVLLPHLRSAGTLSSTQGARTSIVSDFAPFRIEEFPFMRHGGTVTNRGVFCCSNLLL